MTNIGVPLIMTVLPKLGASPAGFTTGTFVGPGTTRNGVLLMTVRLPVRPGGALATGIAVDPGIITKLVPPITVVLPGNPVAAGA